MATAGHDGTVKVWDCRNWKGAVRQWTTRGGSAELEWSQKGTLAVVSGGSVNVRFLPRIQGASLTRISLGVQQTNDSAVLCWDLEPTTLHDTSGTSPTTHVR